MTIGLDEVWRHRRATTRFRRSCTFDGDAIVLGAGTKMLDLGRMVDAPPAQAWTRLAALLKALGHASPSQTTRLHVQTALLDWWRGERALAQLRLALLPLPTLARVDEAYPLFLAEHLIEKGMAPDELLSELERSDDEFGKFDVAQPRLPRGVSGGGEWTRGPNAPSSDRWVEEPGARASASPPSIRSSRTLIQPVFLDTEQQEGEVQTVPFLPRRPDENGNLPPQVHVPTIEPPTGIGVVPWLAPTPMPAPSGGGAGTVTEDRPEPPECLPKEDVPHGASANAMMYEYLLAQLLNPDDPTFKRRPSDPPTPKSQAYFLYVPSMGKFYSMDDCKKTDAIFIFIPEMRKGDGAEFKTRTTGYRLRRGPNHMKGSSRGWTA